MGKKGKKIRSDKKKVAKQALRARNHSYYEGLRDSGNNSKRQKAKKKKGRSTEKGKHLVANCGNIGCQKCYPNDRNKITILGRTASLKLIKKMFPLKEAKPQIHPGRNPSKLSKLSKLRKAA